MALGVGYRLRESRECNWEGIADLRFERDEKQIPRARDDQQFDDKAL